MIEGMKDLTTKVHQTIAALQEEFPGDGFVLIAMRSVGERAVLTLASNVEEDDLTSVLENVIAGEDLGEVTPAKMYN